MPTVEQIKAHYDLISEHLEDNGAIAALDDLDAHIRVQAETIATLRAEIESLKAALREREGDAESWRRAVAKAKELQPMAAQIIAAAALGKKHP